MVCVLWTVLCYWLTTYIQDGEKTDFMKGILTRETGAKAIHYQLK